MHRSKFLEIGTLAVILAAAAVLRFLWLDSIPDGWHHDEALMGIMASEVFRGIDRPIFFPAFLGQEPLYIYLSAGFMWLMGGNLDILPLRIASAVVGVATVGVTYLLGRELYDRRVGLIAAAVLGFSFWHVMLSRDGYRVITQPLLEGLTILLLWMGIRRQSMWCYAAAGVALGGTLYTYLGARVFPGVLVAFALWWIVARGRPDAATLRGAATTFLVGFAVAAPLLFFFATHPGTFYARMEQVSIFEPGVVDQEPLQALFANVIKLLATFTVYGETLWRYNISGRPIFVGAMALVFYLGMAVLVWRAIRRHAQSALLLVWLVVMLAPSFLTYDVGAYTFRSMGLLPALFLVPAVGFVALWDKVVARLSEQRTRIAQWAFAGLIGLVLVIDGGITYRDYFHVWADAFGGVYENMADMVSVSRYLEQKAQPEEEEIFVSSEYCPHPTVAHLAPRVYHDIRWFNGNSALVLSPLNVKPSLYAFPFSAFPEHLEDYLPTDALLERTAFDNGATRLAVYRLTPDQVKASLEKLLNDPTFTTISTNLGDEIELMRFRVEPQVEQGDVLKATVVCRILRDAPSMDYVIFAHLLDHRHQMWTQSDLSAFAAEEWRSGDILIQEYTLKVAKRVPPGRYSLVVGVYDRETMDRLVTLGDPQPTSAVHLAFVKVRSGEQEALTPSNHIGKRLGSAIELVGFDLSEDTDQPSGNSKLRVTLHWQARTIPEDDYTVFVQLLDPFGRLVAQSDSQPADGRSPTSSWEPGEKTIDEHLLALDKSLPAGKYTLIAGMYHLPTLKRLPLEDGPDHVTLTSVDIGE